MKQNTKFDNGTWKIELRKISDLKPNPKNPRTITKDTIKPLGGGTMHGKDLSKADCSVNIYLFLLAQKTNREHRAICSIGDKTVTVDGQLVKFDTIVKTAKKYIESIGGFEQFACWGLQ